MLPVNHIRSFPDSTHTVQERCEFTLDRRLLPGDDPNEAFAEIERVAKEVERIEDPVSGKSYGVEVRLGPFMYPSLVTTQQTQGCQLVRSRRGVRGSAVVAPGSPLRSAVRLSAQAPVPAAARPLLIAGEALRASPVRLPHELVERHVGLGMAGLGGGIAAG